MIDSYGIRWATRGGVHRLHAVDEDLGGGRAAFACGREGPADEPLAAEPTRCVECEEALAFRSRRRKPTSIEEQRRARAASSC